MLSAVLRALTLLLLAAVMQEARSIEELQLQIGERQQVLRYYAHMQAVCEHEAAAKDAAEQNLYASMQAQHDAISGLDGSSCLGCAVDIKDCLDERLRLITQRGLLQRCATAYAALLEDAQQQFASLP
jgi:hypothetical protein